MRANAAAQIGHLDVVAALLERSADVDAREALTCVLSTQDGERALHLAAQNGHTEVVAALLERNADVNAKEWVCARSRGPCSPLLGLLRRHCASERRARVRSCRRVVKEHCASRLRTATRTSWPRCSSAMRTSMLETRCVRACGVNVV